MTLRRSTTGVLACAAGMLVLLAGSPASANPRGPAQPDPERYSASGTAWGYLADFRTSIDVWLNTYNGRAIDVESLGGDRFSVVAVNNSGPYYRTPAGSGSWTANESFSSLTTKLNLGLRPLDFERYYVGNLARFAAVWVENDGAAAKNYKFHPNLLPQQIASRLNGCTCRLIDIDPVVPGGGRYDAIMIPNTGVDLMTWGWLVGASQTQVTNWLIDHGLRPVDIEPDGTGRYTVIAVKDGIQGSVRFGQTWNQVASGPPFGRYIHLKPYRDQNNNERWLTAFMA